MRRMKFVDSKNDGTFIMSLFISYPNLAFDYGDEIWRHFTLGTRNKVSA